MLACFTTFGLDEARFWATVCEAVGDLVAVFCVCVDLTGVTLVAMVGRGVIGVERRGSDLVGCVLVTFSGCVCRRFSSTF